MKVSGLTRPQLLKGQESGMIPDFDASLRVTNQRPSSDVELLEQARRRRLFAFSSPF